MTIKFYYVSAEKIDNNNNKYQKFDIVWFATLEHDWGSVAYKQI